MSNLNGIFFVIFFVAMLAICEQEKGTQKGIKKAQDLMNILRIFAYISSLIILLLIFILRYFYVHSWQNKFVHFYILGLVTIMIGALDFSSVLYMRKNLNDNLKKIHYIISGLFLIIGITLIAIKNVSFIGKILGYDEVFYFSWIFILAGTILTGLKWNYKGEIKSQKKIAE